MKPTAQALEAAQLIRDWAASHGAPRMTFAEAAVDLVAKNPKRAKIVALGIAAAAAQAPRTKAKVLGDLADSKLCGGWGEDDFSDSEMARRAELDYSEQLEEGVRRRLAAEQEYYAAQERLEAIKAAYRALGRSMLLPLASRDCATDTELDERVMGWNRRRLARLAKEGS